MAAGLRATTLACRRHPSDARTAETGGMLMTEDCCCCCCVFMSFYIYTGVAWPLDRPMVRPKNRYEAGHNDGFCKTTNVNMYYVILLII